MQGSIQGSTILVAIDFQEASIEALAVARDLGKRLGMEVVILHVYAMPVAVYPGFEPIYLSGLPEEIAKAAKQTTEQLASSSGGLRSILRSGDPADEIIHAVEETKPAMVVLGTHGRKGLTHLLLGSVAERVVRMSPAPVLTVHAPAPKG